ncbi:3'-5' exonuclease [Pseudonocardia sp.]|uniref:3'-5' exonuclease n=1 Tax=Pseudonocardia sp. TaxID=60912 RepID=UPI003D140854
MGVIMSKEFHKAIDVDGSIKAKAWDFVTKLNQNADLTGLDLKIPKNPADKRVRTARVDLSYRAVLFAVSDDPEPMWVLAAIRTHDEAYEEAQNLVLDINPANGAMEVLRPKAIIKRVEEFRAKPTTPDAHQVLPFKPAELVALGINAEVAEEAVHAATDDDLLLLAGDLPEWQQQVLLDLATGTSLDQVRTIYDLDRPADADPVAAAQRPTSRMQFVYLQTDDELRRMLEGDFAAWRTYLHPTQRAVAYRPTYNGPYRLAGGAGTGKTVVALHRAAFLARPQDVQVLLCTFTRNLAANLQADIHGLLSADELSRVEVGGVDQIVRSVVHAVDGPPGQILGERDRESLWEESVAGSGVPADIAQTLTPTFLDGEYRAVVLALPAHTRDAYFKARRTGRGIRLNRVQRAAVWRVVESFERGLASQGRTTFERLAVRAAEILADPATREKAPTFDHVVVDEGQDLHAGHWRVLRGLVSPGPNDLFIAEDGHQRIYGERIVLGHYGIETRGRSRRLTLNYRTTRQNLAFALGVIGNEPVVDLEGDDESVAGYRSLYGGPTPQLRGFASEDDEVMHVVTTIKAWLAADVSAPTIAVLARRTREQERARIALKEAGIPVELLQRDGPGNDDAVKVSSMHRAKGTEYERVIVIGAAEGVVPLDFVFEGKPESEHGAIRGRERSLFYVACSRAREQLLVTWSGKPSPFIPQLA